MPSTHTGGRELEGYESSWLIPATVPELEGLGRLVVFIHGYGGDAVRTWSMFDLLLQQEDRLRGVDLLFYGYDARWSELVASTGLFQDFLTALMESPAGVLNASLSAAHARAADFRYLSAVICAHSLGAVLARGALLGATCEHAEWTKIIRLVLYAPAHSGARVQRLLAQGFSLSRFLGPIVSAYSFASPLFDQLAEGSPELTDLASGSSAAIKDGHTELAATRILIAERERVVKNRPMCPEDPRPRAVRGATHGSICKPPPADRTALDALLGAL